MKNLPSARIALMFTILAGFATACQNNSEVARLSDLYRAQMGQRLAGQPAIYGTIFGDVVPQNQAWPDPNPVTVGLKFRSSIDGKISGIRMYRGVTNAPFLKVSMWTETGQLLAEGTITAGESGLPGNTWLEVPFTTNGGATKVEVPIKANTVYIASYYAPTGNYAAENEGLTSDVVRTNAFGGTLTALGGVTNGGNGVYLYNSPDGFPNLSYRNTNYFVDVLFSTNATIFGDVVPAVKLWPDPNPVTVGLKFRSSIDGSVSGVRFFRGMPNNGPYRVALWTESGQLLAEGSMSAGEGGLPGDQWVQVPFTGSGDTTPVRVPILANTTYIATYYCATGQYAGLNEGLESNIVTPNGYGGTLTALGGLTNGGNGVYKYADPTTAQPLLTEFPTNSYRNSNYYVDVLFDGN